ncbi:MAG: dihydroneopterin aldolase [Bacteroidales bacterium]|nr:dihydroneopterin aldolase [Bacteroidales bacterium]
MSYISIDNMKFYAYHGCFSEEQKIGTYFTVNVRMETDTTQAQKSDDLSHTVNYLAVYQVVKREMMTPSHLLECVADRIGNAILGEFPSVENVVVKVSKMNPPLGGQMESVSVEIVVSR